MSWHLIWKLARQRFRQRYHASPFGLLSVFAVPLLTLVILSLVFGSVLALRWQQGDVTIYPLILFSGLLVHFFVADCLVQGPNLCREFAPLIKQTSVSTATLGTVVVLDLMGLLLISLVVFSLILSWLGLASIWLLAGAAYLIVVLTPLGLGLIWLTATLGIAWPSFSTLTGAFASALLLLSPILYPLERVPADWQVWFWLNPATAIVENFRALVLLQQPPDVVQLLLPVLVLMVCAGLSYLLFNRARTNIQDLL